MSTILRITRHPLDTDREVALKAAYGDDVVVITEDIQYGADPVGSVMELIERHGGRSVVGIEAQAPFPVTMKLVDARRQLGVDLLRATFARDAGGRAIVTGQDAGGRDILKFEGYELLERIVFETRPLEPR